MAAKCFSRGEQPEAESQDTVIKLGLADSHCLELKLQLALYKPCLGVVRPERGQLHCNSVEQVGKRESCRKTLGWDLQACRKAENIHRQTKNPCLTL